MQTKEKIVKQKRRGKGLPKIQLVQEHLNNLNDYRYNVVTGNIEFMRKTGSVPIILNDYEVNSLVRSLALSGLDYPVGSVRNLLKSDFIAAYDPFRLYFDNLPEWDGTTDHISNLADTVETDEPEQWSVCFKKWLVAMTGSLLDEKVVNHTMLVLTGRQGIGKTTWILNLVPDQLKNYVYSGTINPDNKDAMIFLAECMLINCDELENLNRHQLGSIKELITKNQVRLRRPYGTLFENLVRRASFAGSVNNREFLNDTSGNRRFLCFEVTGIDYRHKTDLDLVYSQALALYRSGFRFWFEPDEIEQINQNNEKFRIISLEEQQLFKCFEPCGRDDATHLLSSSEILHIIFDENRNLINDVSLQRLGKILTANSS